MVWGLATCRLLKVDGPFLGGPNNQDELESFQGLYWVPLFANKYVGSCRDTQGV